MSTVFARPSTFQRSKLNWSEKEKEPHRSLFEWYRELIRLRRRLDGAPFEVQRQGPTLTMRRGELRVICDSELGDVRVEPDLETAARTHDRGRFGE